MYMCKAPEGEHFCVKSNLTVCKVTCNCVTGKNGEQAVLVAPPIILLGEQLLSLLPRFPRLLASTTPFILSACLTHCHMRPIFVSKRGG